MEYIKETAVALLAAIGIATLLYAALRRLFLPPRGFSLPVSFVFSAGDDAGQTENTVRELQELRRSYGENCRIVVLYTGGNEETKRLLRILQREDEDILLLQGEAAETVIKSL